jgi:hypothetical protein
MFCCDCCTFVTTFSSNYKRHLETKKHKELVEKGLKCKGFLENVKDDVNDLNENLKANKEVIKIINCPYCDKIYSCRQSLYEHKKICKSKEISKNISGDVNSGDVNNNTINGNNNNINQSKNISNINNTIIINNYSETDLTKLTDKNYITACNGVNYSVNRLIEMTHYNPEIPENMNVQYTNLKYDRTKIKENGQWIYKNHGLDDLYDKCESILDEWVDNEGNNYPTAKKKYEKYLENKERMIQDIKRDLKILMRNKSAEYFKEYV